MDKDNLKLVKVGMDVPAGFELVDNSDKIHLSDEILDSLALKAFKDGTIRLARKSQPDEKGKGKIDEEKPKDEATLGDFISAMGGLMTAFAPKEDAEKIQEGVNQMAQLFSALEPNGPQQSSKKEEEERKKCTEGHILTNSKRERNWICNGCRKESYASAADLKRYRCQPCNYDICEICFNSHGEEEKPKEEVKDNGGYKAFNLTSSGEAKTKFPQLMGVYKLSEERHNSFPVYKQYGGPGLAHVDKGPNWVVGEQYEGALLFSIKRPITQSPPESQWYYYDVGSSLEWNGTDSTLLMLPIDPEKPLHPNYATLEARLRTFSEWPPAVQQQPQELAEAGFYYEGLSDQVKCFYCDGGLRNWQPEDVPWVEHSRWFSECVFLRKNKPGGIKFQKVSITSSGRMATIEEIQANFHIVEKQLVEWDAWTIALVDGGKLVGKGYGGKVEEGDFNKQVEDNIIGEKIITIESQREEIKEKKETMEVKTTSQAVPEKRKSTLATVRFIFHSKQEASLVEIAGSFNNWTKVGMIKNGGQWKIPLKMKPGVHQYKYIVDGKWEHDEEKPTTNDNMGGLNNVINVDDKEEDVVAIKENEAGLVSRPGATGKFYCGGDLGEDLCSCCSGCGPNDGCNCAPCQKMDIASRKLPKNYYVNKEGASCRRSSEMGLVYCGRKVARSGDGRCGPNDGPQCQMCSVIQNQVENSYRGVWRQDPEESTAHQGRTNDAAEEDVISTKTNEAGQISRPGATGKFYCGGDLGEDLCSCCIGCGPTDGCNCVPCQKMDIASRKLPKNYYVNKEGASCRRSSETGLIYCGRKVANSGDGHCGPNDGPQCQMCSVIQNQVDVGGYRGVW